MQLTDKKIALPELQPLLSWYQKNARRLPWRDTKDPYRIWVSEIMLQQTRVEAVLPYYARFLARLPDVRALAECPEQELLKLWEGLGYYSRVRNMQKAAKSIMEQHGGSFPTDFADIRALCGIGEYTAGAISAFAFDRPIPAVDGNVMRVVARLCAYEGDVLSPTARRAVTKAVAEVIPEDHAANFNQALIELGAIVCLPNGEPKCDVCPLAAVCRARELSLTSALPVRKKAAPRKKELRTVLILREGDRVVLCKRPPSGLLAGLYEPPCLAGQQTADGLQGALAAYGVSPLYLTPLEDAKHIFTHIEWHMVGFEVILPQGSLEKLQIPRNGTPFLPPDAFLAPREEIDERYSVPSAYSAYRPYM